MPSKNRQTMRVDEAFKKLAFDLATEARKIECIRISEREVSRRIGESEKVKNAFLEDSKLRAMRKLNRL